VSRAYLEQLLRTVVDARGSDLHLRAGVVPRLRVNGVLDDVPGASPLTAADTESMAAAVLRPGDDDRLDRFGDVDFAYSVEGLGRFRVNAYRQRDTVALVFRAVVDQVGTIAELGLPDTVRQFAEEPRGLVILAGPTGAGKTTTLAAMVDHINRTRPAHIVTIEDPVEVVHADRLASISQREIGADTPSFADAVRAALRQDPDVILVGEMRDHETVAAALLAAETGQLVLSTLHTTDATETITRIVEFFPPNEQRHARLVLAGVLKGTVCQRLVPTADGLSRVPATEVMVVNGRIQDWILDPDARSDVQEIIARGEYYGMHTFDQSLLALYARGVVDQPTIIAAASNPHDLKVMIRRLGVGPPGTGAGGEQERVDVVVEVVERLTETVADAAPDSDAVAPSRAPRRRSRRPPRP
jgi:twitching motility protein PilT